MLIGQLQQAAVIPHLLSHHELVQKLGSVPSHKLSRQLHNTTAVEQPKKNLKSCTCILISNSDPPPFNRHLGSRLVSCSLALSPS